MKFNTYTIFFILIIILISKSEEAQLRWAFEIFRHGARSPYDGMTSDFKDCFGQQWNGKKELTGVGMLQHFLVGTRNRIKYINDTQLLSPIYNPKEIYLISTDSNRTIMSANAQVQGLYPPGTGPKLSKNQSENAVPPVKMEEINKEKQDLDNMNFTALPYEINIIPVHSFFNADHFIQLQDKKVCPTTLEYYKKNQQRKEIVDFLDKMTEKYGDKLNELLIIKDKSRDVLKDYAKAYYIFDTIICRYTEGYEIPKLNENVSDMELLNDAFKFFDYDLVGNGINRDKEICLYSMSPVFDRILKWIDLKIEKDIKGDFNYTGNDLPRFVMFSAHDSTCAAFMGFMFQVFGIENRYPYFATNINLELYLDNSTTEIKKENYIIEYIINDESMINFTYTNFTDTLKRGMKTIDEVYKFCGYIKDDNTEKDKDKDKESDNENLYLGLSIGLGFVALVLIIVIILKIRRKKFNNKELEHMDEVEPFSPSDN